MGLPRFTLFRSQRENDVLVMKDGIPALCAFESGVRR